MSNKISDKADGYVDDVIEETIQYMMNNPNEEPPTSYYEAKMRLENYISTLETELAALKAELAKYEWQSGHPDDDRDVWVCWNDGLGGKMYESGWYDKNWFDENSMPCNDDAVHAWSEIRPWKGE